MTSLQLDTRFIPSDTAATSRFEFVLTNGTDSALSGFTLAYTALTRSVAGASATNATLLRRVANFHEFATLGDLTLAPGERWRFLLTGLSHIPKHRLDGPKSAYLSIDGKIMPVTCSDLDAPASLSRGDLREIPQGNIDTPIYAVPWPQQVAGLAFRDGPLTFTVTSTRAEEQVAALKIGALSVRLFPTSTLPFRFEDSTHGVVLEFSETESLSNGAYRIRFSEDRVDLDYGDALGRDYGLTVLAQIVYGANTDPLTYKVPIMGQITDSARYSWRASHLDVSRHFWPKNDVLRFLDMMAWARMNVFQWHLTDDEGWRLEIKAFPELTGEGARRGPGSAQVSQLGYAAETYEGHYSQTDVEEIVAHAMALNIEVVPEVDIPGHCTAVLKVIPGLVDPDEVENSYHSVQGYPNNALNPAIPLTYVFLEKVFEEVARMFPAAFVHIGGDEVDEKSWLQSPVARDLMVRENLADSMELQAYFMRKIQLILRKFGKKMAGWDEVSHGGGVDPEGVLLVAWQKPEVTRQLIEAGYQVVASPGQAYYMDMAQSSGWNEPGASWAGVSTPEHCYSFEASSGLTDGNASALKGVQACIWCEHLIDKDLFNHMVFPRLYAVAEAGWTDPQSKNYQRFAAQSRLFPKL